MAARAPNTGTGVASRGGAAGASGTTGRPGVASQALLADGQVLTIPILAEDDIVVARQQAREVARSLGFGMVDQSRIATAVSELTRNVIRYATDSRGEMRLRIQNGPGRQVGLEIVVADEGPGIPDVELALREGYTSGHGLGMGLPGTRRLVDEMDIDTGPNRGTVITIRKWRR